MKNKIVLITGANSGIGFETAKQLSLLGAEVVMMSRNKEKGEAALLEIKKLVPNTKSCVMQCDLADMKSIRLFAEEFNNKYQKLDVLLNNAGIITNERLETVDGFEYQFGVNHLGHFLLTHLLLQKLKDSAPSRIINVSSMAHKIGKINFSDLQLKHKFTPFRAYSQSKLANILFTVELSQRLHGTGVTVNCLHPGVVRTRFAVDRKTNKLSFFAKLYQPFTITQEKGAETSIFLASSPEVQNITGQYFDKKKIARTSKAAQNEDDAKKLWNVSMQLTGLK